MRFLLVSVSVFAIVLTGLWSGAGASTTMRDAERRSVSRDQLTTKLSETGYYESVAAKRLSPRLVPYEPVLGFWSDGANKERFLLVPEGKRIGFRSAGGWEFPDGTTFVQTLSLDSDGERRYLETRVIRIVGEKLEFGSYVWNEAQDDAELKPDGEQFYANVGSVTQLWDVASRQTCAECHHDVTGLILGVTTAQLHRDVVVDGAKRSQLRELERRGVLTGLPEDLDELSRQIDPYDEARSLDARARSYLEVHCAVCHQPGGNGSGTLDLRAETPMHLTGAVKLSEEFELDAGVLVPGYPRRSTLWRRMAAVGPARMPQFLTTVPDDQALELIGAWISSR